MLETDCFWLELPYISAIRNDCLELAENGGGWVEHRSFKSKMLDHKKAIKDDFIKFLANKFELVVAVMKMEPHTTYNWHTDGARKCAVNMLINDAPSHCIFNIETDGYITKYAELKYKPETYYLFNTDIHHMILNGDKTRYMMSIQLNNDITYPELVEIVKGYK